MICPQEVRTLQQFVCLYKPRQTRANEVACALINENHMATMTVYIMDQCLTIIAHEEFPTSVCTNESQTSRTAKVLDGFGSIANVHVPYEVLKPFYPTKFL